MKLVYCNECKYYSVVVGTNIDPIETCGNPEKRRLPDTYYARGDEVKKTPREQNFYNKCPNYKETV